MRKLFIIGFFFVAFASVFSMHTAQATTIGFRAGSIMEDTVMTNSKSMTTSQIQSFLNSKVPSCDTYGQKISEYGGRDLNGDGKVQRWEWAKVKYNQTKFICLKNYKNSSGQTAAQIILDKAKKYSINPQTLIVLLQKEQGLVTDTWPLSIQYRTATGYGCPDTAPCDSQYFGLANQLDWAAKMYHSIITQDPNWYSPYFKGTNPRVYWHPSSGDYVNTSGKNDSRPGCGYNSLTIENWSTASLYSYTPYRPNKAALDAGWGTGDTCSSYGNRNFYSYFTDWFGSTQTPLFKISGTDETIYLSNGDTYYAIPSPAVLSAWGLADKKVLTISSSQLTSYTKGPALSIVVRFGSDATVYLVDRGVLTTVPSWQMLNQYGYGSGDMTTFADVSLKNRFSNNGVLSQLARRSNGAIYFIDAVNRHVFPDAKTYSAKAAELTGVSSPDYVNLSDRFINSVAEKHPVLLNGVTVKPKDSHAIYLHEAGELLPFTPASWSAWGHDLDYGNFSSALLSSISRGGAAPMSVTDGSSYYFVAGGKKLPVSSAVIDKLGTSAADFTSLTNQSIARLPTGKSVSTLLRTPDGAVHSFIDQKRYTVPSLGDFSKLGYTWDSVVSVSHATVDAISASAGMVFAPGSLIRTPDGAVSLIDSNLNRYIVPSIDVFNAYGFSWNKVRNYPSSSLAGYTTSTLRPYIQATGSGPYKLATRGRILTVSSNAYGAAQYNLSTRQWSTISSGLFNTLTANAQLTQYIQGDGAAVYKVVEGVKHPFSSPDSFYEDGGTWSKVTRVSDSFLDSFPTGSAY